ncbi:MYCB2-like protein [Mya arenaria]|uniref:MYCB2-like protein n=1 Tax=Mya arenaria TaxID=6604 RepID=A0ABY7FGP1_MYAAR|nr:MYCB2-like protein [Mya arenaria]
MANDTHNKLSSPSLQEAAGIGLRTECVRRYPNGITYGGLAVTGGYGLACKYVFHISLPPYFLVDARQVTFRTLMKCLHEAHKRKALSIAFPTQGRGFSMYPPDVISDTYTQCVAYFEAQRNTGPKHPKLASSKVCTKELDCGHMCCGYRYEAECPPCLDPDCRGNGEQNKEDICVICMDMLGALPIIQSQCGHIFHLKCIRQVLKKRWVGPRINFNFLRCPICSKDLEHSSLERYIEPLKALQEQVQKLALMHMRRDGLEFSRHILHSESRFYHDPVGFSTNRYKFSECFECQKPYFTGTATEECVVDEDEDYVPESVLCPHCIRQRIEREVESERSEEMIKRTTRKCPHCLVNIERNGVCKYMYCPHCKRSFHWNMAITHSQLSRGLHMRRQFTAKLKHPAIRSMLQSVTGLEEDITDKAMLMLRKDGLLFAAEITDRESPYFNDRDRYALDRYQYYMCVDCKKPFYGGIKNGECVHEDWEEDATCEKCTHRRILKRKKRLKQEKVKTKDVIEKTTKQCPKCLVRIEKEGGCDFVYCTNCKQTFMWTKHYDLKRLRHKQGTSEKRKATSRNAETKMTDSRALESRNTDSRALESRNADSWMSEFRNSESRNFESRNTEINQTDSRNDESISIESKRKEPLLNDPDNND